MLTSLGWFSAISVLLLLMVVLLGVSVVLFRVGSTFDWRLWGKIRRARREISEIVCRRCPGAGVLSVAGATRNDPRFLSFWIKTSTDQERDLLCEDPTIYKEFCDALYRVDYPPAAVPLIHFSIQSQETVDRKFGGSWHEATQFPEID